VLPRLKLTVARSFSEPYGLSFCETAVEWCASKLNFRSRDTFHCALKPSDLF